MDARFEALNGEVDKPQAYGMTALMQAAHRGDAEEVAELIVSGADVNRLNDDGNNALWFAIRSGDTATVELLIGAGVEVDNQNGNGTTPLIWAASACKREMVELLLTCGANPALRTLDDFTAAEVAGNRSIMKLLMATQRAAAGQ